MSFEQPTMDLQRDGITVIHNAFDPAQISGLLANAAEYAEIIEGAVKAGTEPDFPPSYMWWKPALACNLTALDPVTRVSQLNDFNRTSLCHAVMTDVVQAVVRSAIGSDVGWALVRTRTIIPSVNGNNGHLALHMERASIQFPDVHVVWTPLTPIDVVTNEDAPGIQFQVGSDLLCPKLRTGDVAIFDGSVLHGTYIPTGARHWRVGCDIRLFPWTETNHLPAGAIAMGERHERLVWPTAS